MSNPCNEVWDELRNQDVPKIETKSWGLLLLLINIFFPGIGSIVAGLKGDRTSTMIIGLLQFVSSWFILGWIWSIWWGWLLYSKSGGGDGFEKV